MSGPVTEEDAAPISEGDHPAPATLEVSESRQARVGAFTVRRALPRRERRTVGAWCFVDHMGPAEVTAVEGLNVAPHPHMGLQTVTWLLAGEALHRDSLGSEQTIRPGELNLMTAGNGIAHSEESTGRYAGPMHGVQLWVAQPSTTRFGPSAFEHHVDLPKIDLGGATATVLIGDLDGTASPARRDTDHLGIDLDLRAATVVPLRPDYEYALIVFAGALVIDGRVILPDQLAYLGMGRDECLLSTEEPTRALLIGGVPFDDPILMWWNFVARTRDEISAAFRAWSAAEDRFGQVASTLPRVQVEPPPWTSALG